MVRRAAPLDPSIAERIKTRRGIRDWSIRHAASRAGIAPSTWLRIERGEARTDRYMIADLAAALECSVTDLTGQPYIPADRQLESAHIRAEQVWRVMMGHPLSEPGSRPTTPIAMLNRETALIRDLYGRCDYAGALARLVEFVPTLHAAARRGSNVRAALELMVPVYGCTMGSLLNVGYSAHALLAAQRCVEAAESLDDVVALAVAATNSARVLAHSGAYGPARSVCDQADANLQSSLNAPYALDLSGFLHLARALHMAGLHDLAAAKAHLSEAAAIADRTGESDGWDMAWGPSNVALWTMAFQLDTGSSGDALNTAAGVRVAGLPAIRQVYFYMDMARGLSDEGHDDEAVKKLLTAERIGAQHTRSSTAARETARLMLHRSSRPASPELRGLCERMGIGD